MFYIHLYIQVKINRMIYLIKSLCKISLKSKVHKNNTLINFNISNKTFFVKN